MEKCIYGGVVLTSDFGTLLVGLVRGIEKWLRLDPIGACLTFV